MRALAIFISGGVMGFIGGLGVMLVLFPFIFPPEPVNEKFSTIEENHLILETSFREEVSGQDSVHWGRGSIRIYKISGSSNYVFEFQDDFEVGPGPNFWIYLNTKSDINTENGFKSDLQKVKINKLKSFTGSQVYMVSEELYKKSKSLTIWCETFEQYIASANFLHS